MRKIESTEYPTPCAHPNHRPSMMVVLQPGTYEHECPGCGNVISVVVPPNPRLVAA